MTSAERLLLIDRGEKHYGGRMVLQIDKFQLIAGDTILLVGKNGSGKSTFLRVLAGVTILTKGKIERSRLLRNSKIGYVPQAGGLYGDMTLRENLQVYSRMFDVKWEAGRLRSLPFESALRPVLDLPVSQLSGGTQKLATLACILTGQPDALLLDEPSSDLDHQHVDELYSLLADMRSALEFMVVTTHYVRGLEFFDQKLEIADGKIVYD